MSRDARFEAFEFVDLSDAVVVGLRISQPDWSGTVEVFQGVHLSTRR